MFMRAMDSDNCSAPMAPKSGIVYERYKEDYKLSRGPEGIYTRLSDEPGFGWYLEVV